MHNDSRFGEHMVLQTRPRRQGHFHEFKYTWPSDELRQYSITMAEYSWYIASVPAIAPVQNLTIEGIFPNFTIQCEGKKLSGTGSIFQISLGI